PPRGHWTDARLRTALNAYLRDKDVWPSLAEFEADGMRRLGAAVTSHGGAERWAEEFGLPRGCRNNGPRGYWNEAPIRKRLGELCRGRSWFPGESVFRRAAVEGMYGAMRDGHGLQWWAETMGLPRTPAALGQSARWERERLASANHSSTTGRTT